MSTATNRTLRPLDACSVFPGPGLLDRRRFRLWTRKSDSLSEPIKQVARIDRLLNQQLECTQPQRSSRRRALSNSTTDLRFKAHAPTPEIAAPFIIRSSARRAGVSRHY